MKYASVLLAASCLLSAAFGQYYDYVSAYRCTDDSLVARVRIDYYGPAMPVVWNPKNNHLYVSSWGGLYVLDCSTDVVVDSEYAIALPYCVPNPDIGS